MSNISLTPSAGHAKTSGEDGVEQSAATLPWLAQVWQNTIAQWSARLGFAWISVIGLVAVFAPLLASSYPIALKVDGRWSSPLLQGFTPADVTLLFMTLFAVVLWPIKRWTFLKKVLILLGAGFVVAIPALIFVNPPRNEVFDQYRTLEKTGRIERAFYAPVRFSYGDRLRDEFDPDHPHPRAPYHAHPLGTNNNGADVLSQMIHACRIAMAIGLISTGISMVIGVIVGGLMGYFGGLVDLLGMRLIEIFGSLPQIYLLLMFVAAFPDYRNIYLIMAIIGLTSWTGDARFVRAEYLKLRNQDFVQAAIAGGLPLRSILFKHLLPNALAPLLVSASFGIAGAILSESVLSFLGLGIPVGDASWGQLLNDAVGAGGTFKWWLATYPGMAIFLTVLAYNLIGEAVRDALDPKQRKRE